MEGLSLAIHPTNRPPITVILIPFPLQSPKNKTTQEVLQAVQGALSAAHSLLGPRAWTEVSD